MLIILECDCGSHDFRFDPETNNFICNECGNYYHEEEAGKHLIEQNEGD